MNTYKDSILSPEQEDLAFEEFWEDLHSPEPSEKELNEMNLRMLAELRAMNRALSWDNPGSLNEPDKIIPPELW